jgi:hypothetical protein
MATGAINQGRKRKLESTSIIALWNSPHTIAVSGKVKQLQVITADRLQQTLNRVTL